MFRTFRKIIEIFKEKGVNYLIQKMSGEIYSNIDFNIKLIKMKFLGNSSIGLNIFGYFGYMFGNAETARTFVYLFEKAGLQYYLIEIRAGAHTKVSNEEIDCLKRKFVKWPLYRKNLFFINGNAIGSIYRNYPGYFKCKYNIGVWWWEFETGMESYIEGFQYLDEVIVYTEFIKNALMKLPHGKCKISKMTYPFVENWKILREEKENREKYGLKEKEFIFFFNFDYYSSYFRKNPEGVVIAFSKAFKDELNVKIIIKTTNSQRFPEKVKRLCGIIEENGIERQVIQINTGYSRNEMITMINSIDCYVSLHRGEGLGLGMLEAMFLGKPVIATEYGGNTEFMNQENSMLIDYKLITANDDYPVYKDVKYWADPNIEQAARYMKILVEDKEIRENYKMKSQESIFKKYDKNRIFKELHRFIE